MINNGLAIAYGAKIENATGSAFADTLIGNALDNVLDGRGGADIMRGGLGNDTYIVDNVNDVVIEESTLASEIDTVRASVSYTLSTNVENLVLTGNANLNGSGNELDNVITGNAGSNTLVGGAGNDSLYGGAGNDRLEGGEGNDLLDGGAGIDTLIGGQGDDIYYVDNLRDVVIELEGAAEGHDLVRASVSYVLAANVEDGELLGKANLSLTGNELDNVLTGNDGANVLRGGGGADTLIGGLGNDTYYVDSIDDVIIESGTSVKEIDNVFSSVNWTLSDNLENLTLTGTDNINGTGNTQNNRITGNAGDNWLDGGEGIDTLVGGQGNDTYVVDNLRDVVIEGANAGIDTVRASVNWTLGANFENLTLTGLDNLNGTGNTLNNVIIGNAGNNTLNGGAGNDVLDGGAGNDVLIGGLGTDTMTGGQGADTFVFSLLKEMGLGDKRDVITDFNGAEGDRIDLTKIDANVLLKGVNAFTFIGSGDFTGAGQLRFADEILSGNIDAKLGSDGKFTADFEIKLVGVTSFSQDHLAA
jgi:serralysin